MLETLETPAVTPDVPAPPGSPPIPEAIKLAQDLRKATAAVRLRHKKFGVRKALSEEQRDEAAEVFQADAESLSASKKLLNTRHEAYRAVLAIRREATQYWRSATIAYPEPGIRLIRRERIEQFNARMLAYREQLHEAVKALNDAYGELRDTARENLGELYSEDDYPNSLMGQFGLAWDFPSIEAPKYLRELNPALYEQEQARISARFEEAMRMTEEALAAELQELVAALCDRLTGAGDGKPKQIRASAIENLQEFFGKFSSLNIRGNEQLDRLVEQAQLVMSGVAIDGLRKDTAVRETVATKLGEVKASLDTLVVDRPKRRIVLEDEGEGAGG